MPVPYGAQSVNVAILPPIQHDRTTGGSATSCCDCLVAGSQLRESGNPRSSLAGFEFGFPRHQFHLCFIAGLRKGVYGQILRLGRCLHLHWTGSSMIALKTITDLPGAQHWRQRLRGSWRH
jgi:hypothetical protein